MAPAAEAQVSGWSRRGRLVRALFVLVETMLSQGAIAGLYARSDIVRFEFAPFDLEYSKEDN